MNRSFITNDLYEQTVSKFEELCTAWIESSNDFQNYKNQCCALIRQSHEKLIEYLECQKDQIRAVSVEENLDLNKTYNIYDLMKFK